MYGVNLFYYLIMLGNGRNPETTPPKKQKQKKTFRSYAPDRALGYPSKHHPPAPLNALRLHLTRPNVTRVDLGDIALCVGTARHCILNTFINFLRDLREARYTSGSAQDYTCQTLLFA